MDPEVLGKKGLEIELFEWILYGASGDCMQQLLKVPQSEHLAEVLLHIDMMLLFDYNPELATKFIMDFGRIYWILKRVIKALLVSKVFMLPLVATNEEMDLIIRFRNYPAPPMKFYCPSEREMKFVSYAGLIVGCLDPENIGKFGIEETPFQTIRIQRLLIMPKLLKVKSSPKPEFSISNQVHTLIVDREYVGKFHAGQFVSGVGEISIADFLDVKKATKNRLAISAFVVYANSVEAVPSSSTNSYCALGHRQFTPLGDLHSCVSIAKKIPRICNSQGIVPTSTCQQVCLEWDMTMSILSAFDVITGELGYLKIKLLLLLSLVSEPQISSLESNKVILEQKSSKAENSRSSWSPKSFLTGRTDQTWELSNDDYAAIDNQISLLFVSSDSRLSRLVNWAFNFYPVKSKLTLFSNSNVPEAIPEGSLILLQGNCLAKKSHVSLVTKLLKASSPDNPRNKPCIAWCLYPEQLTTTEVKHLRKLAAQSTFQCSILETSYSSNSEEQIAKEADVVLDSVSIYTAGSTSRQKHSFESLSERLTKARLISVSFTESSRNLIKAYFLTSRAKAEYSLRDFQLVIRLARAHARLQLKSQVNVVDAIVGIMLVEEMRAELEGDPSTLLGFPAQRNDPCCLYYEHLYDGNSKPTKFLNMFLHLVSTISQYQIGFRLN